VVNATAQSLYTLERDRVPNCTGGWVTTSAGLDGCGKSGPLLGFDPWTVQPVRSRYSEYAIAALFALYRCLKQIEIYLHAFDTSSCLHNNSVLPVVFSYTDEHRPLRLSITNPVKMTTGRETKACWWACPMSFHYTGN
jgi:hypothetical protein